jgi:putative spermidine/putrescine transport system permease protein
VIAASLRRAPEGLRRLILTYSNIAANFVGVPLAFAFIIMFGFNGAFTLILKRYGLVDEINIYSFGGLILVYSYFQVSLAALLIYPGLAGITFDLEEAARLMGVSRLRFWWRVGLPILRNSLIAVFCLLFANAMGTYATVYALVGGSANVVTVRIGELVGGDVFSDPNLANALSIVLVVTLLIPVVLGQVLSRREPAHA